MRPYEWQKKIYCGEIEDELLFYTTWLKQNDPKEYYLNNDRWDERDQILRQMKKALIRKRFPLTEYQTEIQKTRETMKKYQETASELGLFSLGE